MTPAVAHPDSSRLDEFLETDPVVAAIRSAAGAEPVYLVGGAIRDALCGFPVDDLDLVVEGDPYGLVAKLDPGARRHPRFGTAELNVNGFPVDVARARTETYPRPGSLPVVTFGSLNDDLGRRDFTVNTIAVPLAGSARPQLIDPFGGLEDLRLGLLRVLHADSFRDDPTRVIRGARYAARFGFRLSPDTAALLDTADFSTISSDRYRAELLLAAGEPRAVTAYELLDRWGAVPVSEPALELARKGEELLSRPAWHGAADRSEVIYRACFDLPSEAITRLGSVPATPYDGAKLASAHSPVELVLARAAGATWLDQWREAWRDAGLEITGSDLVTAGIPEGPAVGAGIEAARKARLNHGTGGAGSELEIALDAARRFIRDRSPDA